MRDPSNGLSRISWTPSLSLHRYVLIKWSLTSCFIIQVCFAVVVRKTWVNFNIEFFHISDSWKVVSLAPQSECTRTPYVSIKLPFMNLKFCVLLPMMIREAVKKTFASVGTWQNFTLTWFLSRKKSMKACI